MVSNDESRVFTTCNEDIEVVDLTTGGKIAELKGDTEIVTTFAVTPDGSRLVSASHSMHLSIWDLQTFKTQRVFKAHEAPVLAMDIDSTSTLVATGSADNTVKVWDIERGYCTHNFKGHSGLVTAVKFHPVNKDKLCLVTASDDGVVRIWNLHSRKCEAALDSHVSAVKSIDFTCHDEGRYMITAGRDSVINVWDWKRKSLIRTIPIYESAEATGLLAANTRTGHDIGDCQNIVFTGGERGIIRLWDMDSGKELYQQPKELNAKHAFVNVLYLPKSQNLVAVTNDQNLLFYKATQKLQRVHQIVGYNEEIIDMAYVGLEQKHLAVATNTEQLRLYDTENLNCELAYGHKDIILCVVVHNSGCIIATGSKDNSARVWAVNTRNAFTATTDQPRVVCIATAVGHTKAVGAVCLARDGSCPSMVTGSEDRTVKMWDLSPLREIIENPELAAATIENMGGPIKLQSLYTFQAHDKDINSISIAPGDTMFVTGSQDKTAKIWDMATGKALGTLQGHRRGVWNVSFSPVDRVVATTSGDRTIKLWSLSDYSCLKTLEGHTNSVLCVEFLTRGTQLLTTGSDGLIKLWNIKDGECVLTLDKHENKIWTLAKQQGESFVATGGADSTIYIWKDTTQEHTDKLLKDEAKQLAQQQALDNFLVVKDYRNAITLALSLDQPRRLLNIFQEVIKTAEHGHGTGSEDNEDTSAILGSLAVDQVVTSLAPDQLDRLLKYVRNWNTNGKFAQVAQAVLYCILTHYTSTALLELPSAKEMISALQPYSERHFSRIDGLLTESFIVDYTLHAMDAIGGSNTIDVDDMAMSVVEEN